MISKEATYMKVWRARNPEKSKANSLANHYRHREKYLAQKRQKYLIKHTPVSHKLFLNYSEGTDERTLSSYGIFSSKEYAHIMNLNLDKLPQYKKQCKVCHKDFIDKDNNVCYWCR